MPDKGYGTIHKMDAALVGLTSYPQWSLPQQKYEGIVSCILQKNDGIVFRWRIKSAIIVVSSPFLHIPRTIDKLLNSQLIDTVLAQVVVDNFFSDQVQNLLVIV